MIATLLLAGTLFVGVLVAHFFALKAGTRWMAGRGAVGFAAFCLGLFVLHLFEVGLFAGGFEIGRALGLGEFQKPAEADAMDVFYFSLASFTTLGLGKVMPIGHLASLAGIESFTGFLCVSMSAAALFKQVEREL